MKKDNCPVALYDMSIEDVRERRENRLVFEKLTMAANFLGLVPGHFSKRIGVGKYAYHRETGQKYAVRKIKTGKV